MDLANIFEWAGVSFGREETYLIFMSIKKLVQEKDLKSARLFGKIFGSEKDYIVVESERREGDEGDAEEEPAPAEQEPSAEEEGLPKSTFKPTLPAPKEVATGVNKYVYWVCNLGELLLKSYE